VVNFNLKLAQLVAPDRPWRIVTSHNHSTVWDGDSTLFDLNGLALINDADECFRFTVEAKGLEELALEEFYTPGLPVEDYLVRLTGLRLVPLYEFKLTKAETRRSNIVHVPLERKPEFEAKCVVIGFLWGIASKDRNAPWGDIKGTRLRSLARELAKNALGRSEEKKEMEEEGFALAA
jgi:hypothetical protein